MNAEPIPSVEAADVPLSLGRDSHGQFCFWRWCSWKLLGTALYRATARKQLRVMQAIVASGADANAPANLMVAAPARWRDDFAAEAALAKSLHHPNLVGCYGCIPDAAGGALLLLQEYCAGGTLLQQVMHHVAVLVVAIAAAVAAGLWRVL